MWIVLLAWLSLPQEVPDGSLYFVQNGSRAVKLVTDSSITHVGIIFNEGGKPYLYEAVMPQVHKIPLSEKTGKTRRGSGYFIIPPPNPYSDVQVKLMKAYAESHLGRPYSLQGYVSGKPQVGEHCAQYVASILKRGGWTFVNPPTETPASIWHRYK